MPNEHDTQLLIEVGRRLRQARDAHGLNLHELARLSGVSASALSLIETGKRDTRLTTLSRIAAALRLPLGDLLDGRTAPPQADTSADGEGYDLGDYQ